MSLVNNRILVSGGCGFIGSHVVEHLLDEGAEVLVVDNFRTGKLENLDAVRGDPSLRVVESDVGDSVLMRELFVDFKPSAIIHLAALVSVQESIDDPSENYALNVGNTQKMLELARELQVKRFVFASSAAIYGNPERIPIAEENTKLPLSPYGMGKWVSEQLMEQYRLHYGMEAVALRFFNVFGPRQDPKSPYSGVVSIFSDRIRAGKELRVFGDGLQTRDFIYVKDVASAVVQAATRAKVVPGAYNVCTGRGTTLNELIEVLSGIAGVEPGVVFEDPRVGDILESVGQNGALLDEFEFNGFTSVEDGLRALLAG